MNADDQQTEYFWGEDGAMRYHTRSLMDAIGKAIYNNVDETFDEHTVAYTLRDDAEDIEMLSLLFARLRSAYDFSASFCIDNPKVSFLYIDDCVVRHRSNSLVETIGRAVENNTGEYSIDAQYLDHFGRDEPIDLEILEKLFQRMRRHGKSASI